MEQAEAQNNILDSQTQPSLVQNKRRSYTDKTSENYFSLFFTSPI